MKPLGVPTKIWLATTSKSTRHRRAKAARSRARMADRIAARQAVRDRG